MRRWLAVTTAAVAMLSGVPTVAQAPSDHHVILISLDGFAAYHLNNPALDLPNLRALAASGVAAESSETVFPSLTHPSHTTLITGVTPRRHGVTGNTVENRHTGARFHITNLPRRESVRAPTIFDAIRAAGRRSAALFWPETKDDPAIDDNIAEVFRAEGGADPAAVTPGLLQELRTAGVPIDTFYAFYDDPYTHGAGDLALTRAAAYVFAKRRPALMALHLLITDKAQHEFGPDHYLAAAALSTVDYCVGVLRQAVREAGLADRTTFVIGADHGFVTVRDEMNLAPVLAEPGLDPHMRWRAESWYVYRERLPTFDAARHEPLLERVLTRAAATVGIRRVIRAADLPALGFPDYADNPYARGHVMIAANIDLHLVLNAKDASTARRPKAEAYHGHGYLPDHPAMYPLLLLSGAGIAPGRHIGHVRNIDVAPTIAALLGLEMRGVEGRVLTEALVAGQKISR